MHLSPDRRHETNHGPACRAMFGGLQTCDELAGVNLSPHEQNYAKNNIHLRSLNVMGCDSFAFMVTLVNELENQPINHRPLDRLVEKLPGHAETIEEACKSAMWQCGR